MALTTDGNLLFVFNISTLFLSLCLLLLVLVLLRLLLVRVLLLLVLEHLLEVGHQGLHLTPKQITVSFIFSIRRVSIRIRVLGLDPSELPSIRRSWQARPSFSDFTKIKFVS